MTRRRRQKCHHRWEFIRPSNLALPYYRCLLCGRTQHVRPRK